MVLEKLKSEFKVRSSKNSAYSLRAFARSLDLDSSTLSGLLSGKRKLSLKTAQRILDKLELTSVERKELLFGETNFKVKSELSSKTLQEDQLQIVSGWQHYAILSLLETQDFQSSVKWIANQFGLSVIDTRTALERLEKMGLIEFKDQRYKLCQNGVMTTEGIPSGALKKAHREYIEKAIFSLENHATNERDISGTTMAISKAKLPQAKKLIQEFRKSLAELLESGKKEEVYRLNVQLFPLKNKG